MEFTFEKLEVWQKSRSLVKDIYQIIFQLPNTEKYALADQLRRTSISVPSNIAEGSGRPSNKERVRFVEIAYGSLMETYCQLLLACDLGYIEKQSVEYLKPKIEEIAKMLSGFRKSLIAQGI